jgi:hypothetical protein
MRVNSAWLVAVAMIVGCARERPPRPQRAAARALATLAPPRSPDPTPSAAPATPDPPAPAEVVATFATCAETEVLANIRPALEANAPFTCRLADGGVAFRINPNADRRLRFCLALATVMHRQLSVMPPAERERERVRMDAELRARDEHWVTPGLILRSPERAALRFVRLTGTARDVRDEDVGTSFAMLPDATITEFVGFRIVAPFRPDDDVVAGARVRVYGIYRGPEPGAAGARDEREEPMVCAGLAEAI